MTALLMSIAGTGLAGRTGTTCPQIVCLQFIFSVLSFAAEAVANKGLAPQPMRCKSPLAENSRIEGGVSSASESPV